MSDPTSSSGDPGAFADALARARELLQVEGSLALRLQAQQQAALELLQARKFGAREDELEALLTGVVETSLERLLS